MLRDLMRRFLVDPTTIEVRPEGFDDHARILSLRYAQIGALTFAGAALGFWPTDALVMSSHAAEVFAISRPVTATLAIIGGLALRAVSSRPNLAYVVIAAVGVVITACLGGLMARAGGLDEQWFYFSYFIPWCGLLVVAPLRTRIGLTAAITATYPIAYFAVAPAELDQPHVGSSLVFLTFAAAASVIVGHVTYRIVRADYRLRSVLESKIAERTAVLARLADHLEDSREHERRRVSRELHDETAQLLTGMRLEVALMRRALGDHPGAEEPISRLCELIDQSFDAHRSIIAALRPRILDELGLVAAIRQQLQRAHLKERLEISFENERETYELDERSSLVAFRTVQEALTNVTRHADAQHVRIRLSSSDGMLRLEVADDGRGFDPASISNGFGLLGLRERLRGLSGHLDIDSAPGRGTRLVLTLPERSESPGTRTPSQHS
jgi:signal transduction histidine kinase